MYPELAAIAATQGGLFTRAQAAQGGLRSPALRGLVAPNGPCVVVRRGVYCLRELWERSTPVERERLRDRAVHLRTRVPHLMSHDSAARLLDLPMLNPRNALSHLTRPGVGGSRSEHGIKHHLGRQLPEGNVEVDGIMCTGLARTALDLAREHGLPAGLVACDAALRRGVTTTELRDHLEMMTCWPNVTRAREATRLADGGAETPGESLMRLLVVELGLGQPWTQFPLRVDGRVVFLDLLIGCHDFEFDGKVKYLPAAGGGIATRPAEEVVWAEKLRERRIAAEGLGVSRVVWDDLFGAARERTAKRLAAEYAITAARFGTRTPDHLVDFALRYRGARRTSA